MTGRREGCHINPVVRLALFVALLVAVWVTIATTGIVDPKAVEDWIASTGPLAPVVYVAVSGVLGAMFVSGPVLAGISGFLFGWVVGSIVTLCSAIVSAVIACLAGRLAGREGARRALGDKRMAWLDHQIDTRGLWAVVGQRMIPGMADAPANYSFGALGMALWQIAAGTAVGSAPRAFVYTAVGSVIHNPSPWLGVAAAVIWIAMAVVGLEGVRRMWKARHQVPTEEAEPRS